MPEFSLSEGIAVERGFDIAARRFGCVLLVFQLSDRFAAFRLEDVERITPMAELAVPPGLPSVLEGILNLAGVAIPVLRMDRLFDLPTQRLGLYSMVVILRTRREVRLGILADRVSEILSVPQNVLLPIDEEDSINSCAEATVAIKDRNVHVLSPNRLLLAKERAALSEFQSTAQRRLQDCQVGLV
jgi:purine-binding chemotaxis protein CheW